MKKLEFTQLEVDRLCDLTRRELSHAMDVLSVDEIEGQKC